MPAPVYSVLFVSRTNALRSQMAQACLRHLGPQQFRSYSCGVPGELAKAPSDWAVLALQTAGMATDGLRCKAWTEFTRNGAPRMDFVIGLDADTYGLHPAWPGQPETALWSIPEVVTGKRSRGNTGVDAIHTLHALRRRIELLVSLASRGLHVSELRHDVRDLARI